jgi:hypothetical protein
MFLPEITNSTFTIITELLCTERLGHLLEREVNGMVVIVKFDDD